MKSRNEGWSVVYRGNGIYVEKKYIGADCYTCPYGEACGYGYNASPDCGYETRKYTPTPEELEEWKKNGLI